MVGARVEEVLGTVSLGGSRRRETTGPVDVGNPFSFGLSGHGRHLNGVDFLRDDGVVGTCDRPAPENRAAVAAGTIGQ